MNKFYTHEPEIIESPCIKLWDKYLDVFQKMTDREREAFAETIILLSKPFLLVRNNNE